jgi:hypothetical protein
MSRDREDSGEESDPKEAVHVEVAVAKARDTTRQDHGEEDGRGGK